MAPNAATLVQAAMKAVTGVGAPWYTSGVQEWKGGGVGRALVHVRGPGLERDRGDLEQQANGDHGHPHQEQRVRVGAGADALGDVAEVEGTGEAEQQRGPEQEERGRERA